jgi:hypothetical protein
MILLIIAIGLSLTFAIIIAFLSRTNFSRWLAIFIIPFLCCIAYSTWDGIEELKGHPTGKLPDGEFEILYVMQNPPYAIWFLIKPVNGGELLLFRKKWSKDAGKDAGLIDKDLKEGKPKLGKKVPLGDSNRDNKDDDTNDDNLQAYDFNPRESMPK